MFVVNEIERRIISELIKDKDLSVTDHLMGWTKRVWPDVKLNTPAQILRVKTALKKLNELQIVIPDKDKDVKVVEVFTLLNKKGDNLTLKFHSKLSKTVKRDVVDFISNKG